MKWPKELVLVRHGKSRYNELRERKMQYPDYLEFKRRYEAGERQLQELAGKVKQMLALRVSDRETQMTAEGWEQARKTGKALKKSMCLPDVVYVSPYLRAMQTFQGILQGWPELGNVQQYVDERIREQDHGRAVLYNDWRVFFAFHSVERELYELLGSYDYRYPNGENVPDVRMRVRDWRATIIREFREKRVLAITHHLTILSFRADQERLSPEEFKHLDEKQKPVNCGVTIYRGDATVGKQGRLVLDRYNEKMY